MRRDGTLVERFASGALVLRQLLLIGHQRGVGRARQIALALLNLSRAALALLALDDLGPRLLLISGIVRLVYDIAVPAARAAALIGLVWVDVRLPALALPQVAGVRAVAIILAL